MINHFREVLGGGKVARNQCRATTTTVIIYAHESFGRPPRDARKGLQRQYDLESPIRPRGDDTKISSRFFSRTSCNGFKQRKHGVFKRSKDFMEEVMFFTE